MRLSAWLAAGLIATVPLASCASDSAQPVAPGASPSAAEATQTPTSSSSQSQPTTAPTALANSSTATASSPTTVTGAPVPAVSTRSAEFDADRLDRGAGRFPPLNDPSIVSAAEATWLDDETLILGAMQNGEARAYPIFMLRYHHVSNDVLGGDPYLVTF